MGSDLGVTFCFPFSCPNSDSQNSSCLLTMIQFSGFQTSLAMGSFLQIEKNSTPLLYIYLKNLILQYLFIIKESMTTGSCLLNINIGNQGFVNDCWNVLSVSPFNLFLCFMAQYWENSDLLIHVFIMLANSFKIFFNLSHLEVWKRNSWNFCFKDEVQETRLQVASTQQDIQLSYCKVVHLKFIKCY